MLILIETAAFIAAEAMLIWLKSFIEAIINRFGAAAQMAIATGYRYELALKITHGFWLVLAVGIAIMYIIIIYVQARKEDCNEED